ncbi:hypothetical protein BXZ70DRAFT_618326 [Cristinia sonorae]|uniref:Uncharacterized protein n=1 Tax=Cristinia sonorae TaxID=1940300 RepID=A0A8K0UUN6_9AGAR|nr:hypothetical protein BXZ70DRAFT_618326 [Cristinia sonorae]
MSCEMKRDSIEPPGSPGKKTDSGRETPDYSLALLLLGLAQSQYPLLEVSLNAPPTSQKPSSVPPDSPHLKVQEQLSNCAQPRQAHSFATSRRTSLISMDTHYNASLVYHQHPGTAPFPTPASLYPSNPHEMSWQSSHSPPNSSSSQDHPMYPPMSRSQEHAEYDSQPSQSPSYIQSRHPQGSPTHHQHQSYHIRDSSRDVSFGEGSMGQNRIFTRPPRRDARLADEGQVEAGPSSAPSDQYDHTRGRTLTEYLACSSMRVPVEIRSPPSQWHIITVHADFCGKDTAGSVETGSRGRCW